MAQRPSDQGLAEVIPEVTPIDRVSTNAWEDIREAVEATGRRTLLIASIWTEVCLAQTAVSARWPRDTGSSLSATARAE